MNITYIDRNGEINQVTLTRTDHEGLNQVPLDGQIQIVWKNYQDNSDSAVKKYNNESLDKPIVISFNS